MSNYNVRILDNDGHWSTSAFKVDDGASDPELQAVYDAINGVSMGTNGEGYVTERIQKQVGSSSPPADADARKYSIWVVKMTDNIITDLKQSFSIACADASLAPGTNVLDIGTGVGAALKAAVEAVALSKAGNPCTVTSIELRGRNFAG